MSGPQLDYGRLVERALRSVVREALAFVLEHGLPARNHLFITFRTDHPGVVVADDLRARYPSEMTIVLQHEFWDLEVGPERFAVTLSFGEVPHRLDVPFEAVSVFADPGVEFGLQFTTPKAPGETPAASRPKEVGRASKPGTAPEPEAAPRGAEGGAEVVALDRFRKK